MFRNLKLKLTLTNLLVVGFIFISVFLAIYILMEINVTKQSQQLLRMIVAQTDSASLKSKTNSKHRWFDYFYAKVNSSGNITETSSNLPVTKTELNTLVKNALENRGMKGKIKLGKFEHDEDKEQYEHHKEKHVFEFQKASLSNHQGFIFVFISEESEDDFLEHLLSVLSTAGLIGLFLTLLGSFFMAQKALIPIEQSWQRQKNFVADASHELRTPLSVIQTNLELVMDNPEETVEKQLKWLENIDFENKRMTKLVNDLLFLARADSNQKMLSMDYFLLFDTLRKATEPFKPVAGKEKIDLQIKCKDELSFFGDKARIQQLMIILIDNAIKHTPSGGKITLELKNLDDYIELSISDTGEGIEPEHLEKIFQRFYRIDKARSRQSGGTGLGLAIAEWIVREHQGAIKVSSIPEKETIFRVILPKLKP